MKQFSNNGHSSDGKPKKRIRINDEMPRGGMSHEESRRRILCKECPGKKYARVPEMLRYIISHQFTEIVVWLMDRAQWLSEKKNLLGPKYKGWSYLTTKRMLSEFPFLARGKKNAKSAQMAVTHLFKNLLGKWVETKTGEELAQHLGIDIPSKWRAFRWYRVRCKKIYWALERVARRKQKEYEAWRKKRDERKKDAKRIEGSTAVEWARKLRDALTALGKIPAYDEARWARTLAALARSRGEEEVGENVDHWTRGAKRAASEGLSLKKDLGLPDYVIDAKSFCSPRIQAWIRESVAKRKREDNVW